MAQRKRKSKKEGQPRPFYLDTSVYYKYTLGPRRHKEYLRDKYESARRETSLYVRMEYCRGLVGTLIELYFLARELNSVIDAVEAFLEFTHPREVKIVAQWVTHASRDESDNIPIHTLKKFIYEALQRFGRRTHGYVPNLAQCPLSKPELGPDFQDQDLRDFKDRVRCQAACDIDAFWRGQRGKLKMLLNSEGFPKVAALRGTYQEVLASPERGKMVRNCMRLGDTIIAIECPADRIMLSLDGFHGEAASIMKRECEIVPSERALRRARET